MKRWQSMLISLALVFASGYATQIKDENLKNAALGGITAVGVVVAKKTSEANPDGTKAETPYKKPDPNTILN